MDFTKEIDMSITDGLEEVVVISDEEELKDVKEVKEEEFKYQTLIQYTLKLK